MNRLLLTLTALVAMLIVPTTSAHADTPSTDCVAVARTHEAIAAYTYPWGTAYLCSGGFVYVARNGQALRAANLRSLSTVLKLEACNRGVYVRSGLTLFVAKNGRQDVARAFAHRFGGKVLPVGTLPTYKPSVGTNSWGDC
jgi:hypothetical protein